MDKRDGSLVIIEQNRIKRESQIYAIIASVVNIVLGLYTAAMSWDMVRGLARYYQMNMLLTGKFEHDTTRLSGIVRSVDIFSGVILVVIWMILIFILQHLYEKAYQQRRLPPLLGKSYGTLCLLLSAVLLVGVIFGGQTASTTMTVQIVIAAVVGVGLWVAGLIWGSKIKARRALHEEEE